MAIPPRAELLADLAQKHARLEGALARQTGERRLRLNTAGARLPDLPSLLGNARVKLDDRAQRLVMALPNLLAARRAALVAVERHLADPGRLVAAKRNALDLLTIRLRGAAIATLQARRTRATAVLPRLTAAPLAALTREQRAKLEGLAARLEGASYAGVLARGFALVQDRAGHAVTSAVLVKPGAKLALRFADGTTQVTADGAPQRQASLAL